MALKKNMSFEDWMGFFSRWKWLMIFTFLVVMFIASAYCVVVKNVYKSSTTIIVIPQKIPDSYIKSTVTYIIEDRLSTIRQQIKSRTRLLGLVEEFDLFPELQGRVSQDELVKQMSKRVSIELKGGSVRGGIFGSRKNAFTIEFYHEDPHTAMLVTSSLASTFMVDNLAIMEKQATGTSAVLENKLKSVKWRVDNKRKEINLFKQRYLGELPEQKSSNLGLLTRYQEELKLNTTSIKAAEDRCVVLDRQITELKVSSGLSKGQQIVELMQKRKLEDVKINKLLNKRKEILRFLEAYSARLENTPKRELGLAKIERDYNNLLRTYEELLEKKNNADMSQDLEKKQKGEQFQIIDPAYIPEKKFKPKRMKIVSLAFILSLALGFWGSVICERFDKSIKSPGEFKEIFNIPILVSLPEIITETHNKRLARKRAILAGSFILYFTAVVTFSCFHIDKIRTLLTKLIPISF